MKFSAHVQNDPNTHQVTLKVGDREQPLSIAPRPTGGSSVSGGELLFLALATCFCNDIYREAAKRDIEVDRVEVEVMGNFEAEGKPGSNIVYRAKVDAKASPEEIRELLSHSPYAAKLTGLSLRKAA